MLSASVQAQIEKFAGGKGSCRSVYSSLSAGGPEVARADTLTRQLVALRKKGASGFALWVGPRHQKYVMPMIREAGGWKVGQIAPVPYPLESAGGGS